MKPEIRLLLDKHNSGIQLNLTEVSELMDYALEILKEFEEITDEKITFARKRLHIT